MAYVEVVSEDLGDAVMWSLMTIYMLDLLSFFYGRCNLYLSLRYRSPSRNLIERGLLVCLLCYVSRVLFP